ncbi:hypothetical protein LCGC14_1103130 [marine sediment metagenome]|uniref:Uncharacterized protein n=1 Tax=marine sediment metagenome TaxID=412755 RepID=A0A0F9QF47_9ZZZZ
MTIKFKNTLLQNIADGLNKYQSRKIIDLEVQFFVDKELVMTRDVPTALNYLVNDIYWDEDNDWSDANHAKMRIL